VGRPGICAENEKNMSAPTDLISSEKLSKIGTYRWSQVLVITLGAVLLYVIVRCLPTGTNLSHMDFRSGGSSVEFCDPANPQFMPVVTVRSPVEMTLASDAAPIFGHEVLLTATLKTVTGKRIAPEDLLVVHTQKLHLLVIDPTLTDYQHVHPTPGKTAGDWVFSFVPRKAGLYRIFADFTPAATARGLYASADLTVSGSPNLNATVAIPIGSNRTYEESGYTFELRSAAEPLRAGSQINLSFTVSRRDGGAILLQPVMGAYAHLVAFDAERNGFAHLHPNETDLSRAPDSQQSRLTFKLTIPHAGRYVIWSQVNLDGRDVFAPFWFEVIE
jgi:hypothetical protein